MMRSVQVLGVTLLVGLTAGRVASAQGTLPGGATLTFDPRVFLHEDGSTDLKEPKLTPDSLWKYFNLAHCQCSKEKPDFVESKFAYLLTAQGVTMQIDRQVEILVGDDCDQDAATRLAQCHTVETQVGTVSGIADDNGVDVEIPVYDLATPVRMAGMPKPECAPTDFDANVWAAVASTGMTLDYFISKTIKVDTRAPDLPTSFRVAGGDGAIELSWTPPSNTLDPYYYQVLCARADDDTPGKTTGRPPPRYLTGAALCAINKTVDLGSGIPVTGGDEGPPVTLPAGMMSLAPEFLCGEVLNPAATSIRVGGLQNDVKYKIALVSVDKFQNAVGTFFTSTATPVPGIDFWEDLHDRGSTAEGGLCIVGRSGGHGPLTSALCLVVAVWLARRRRRAVRGARGGAGIAVIAILVVGVPGVAHAGGGGYQPYWETTDPIPDDQQGVLPDASLVRWHAGIRVGPYTPDVDGQLGASPGPFAQMFGKSHIMPMLDVDRFLWTDFGQVGVGISLGYMQTSNKTFTLESDPNAPDRERSAGDENTFRLIPMALTATYRFTYLDDTYGIPVVPYVRGGLSYYLWWVSVSGGGLAKVCKDGGMLPDCSTNKALGGSLGVQGSFGLAIRAERIDPSTAMSMQQSGIMHAGIYGELSIANVDGFGSDKKLSVGDRTWFAGVNFEF